MPKLPPAGAHLWTYFRDLASTRQTGGMGPSRLSRQEMMAWEAVEGIVLERWERRAIIAIDEAWLDSVLADLNKADG